MLDLREIDALLARTVGHPGHGCLRRALALYREPAFTRSGLERRFLALAAEAGLPRPSTGYNEEGHELDVTQVTDLRLAREPEQVMKRVARLWRRSGERVRREGKG